MTDRNPGIFVMTLTARLSPRHIRCMHCMRDLHRLPDGRWADSDHITVCMQPTGLAVTVHHIPLPQI